MATINEDGVEIGMVCCYGCWTDRNGAKVIHVTKKTFTVQELTRGKNKRPWPDQDWEVEDRTCGAEIIVRKNKHGKFVNGCYSFSKPWFMPKENWGHLFYVDPSF